MDVVRCGECAEFIHDSSHDPNAIGTCQSVSRYLDSLGREIRPSEHDKMMDAIGNFDTPIFGRYRLCRPNIERLCKKFKEIKT